MKLNLLIISTFLLFISAGTIFGQSYTFKVLANKGANKVKSEAAWQPLKTGASLNSGDELTLSENAYLGLVHFSGKTLEIRQEGRYKVSDLAEKINKEGSSVVSKYADFILNKMSAEGKKNRLSATGAVHRGSNQAIQVFIPNSGGIYNDKAIIRWDSLAQQATYVVMLKNMFDDMLLSIETNEPQITLDLTRPELSKEKVLLLSVTAKGEQTFASRTYAIKKLSEEKSASVAHTLNNLKAVVDRETALNKYILAGFYEENNLLIDALTSYEEAIALAPEVENYKNAYLEFLLRNHLKQ